ncbi:MAG: hypothetical protein QXQ14_03105 [Candidatus Aenigmatarchaeota archaeon]
MTAGSIIAIIIFLFIIVFLIYYFFPQGVPTGPTYYSTKALRIEVLNFNSTFNKQEEKTFKVNLTNIWKYNVDNLDIYVKLSPDWKVNNQNAEKVKVASINSLTPNSYYQLEISLKAPNVNLNYPFNIIANYTTNTKLYALLSFSKEKGGVLEKKSDGIVEISDIKTNFSDYGKVLPINISLKYDDSKYSIVNIREETAKLNDCKFLEKEKIFSCNINVATESTIAIGLDIRFMVVQEVLFSSNLKIV